MLTGLIMAKQFGYAFDSQVFHSIKAYCLPLNMHWLKVESVGTISLILRLARNTVPTLSESQFANGGIALLNLILAPSLFVAICLVE